MLNPQPDSQVPDLVMLLSDTSRHSNDCGFCWGSFGFGAEGAGGSFGGLGLGL